jgi:hypothetical protein
MLHSELVQTATDLLSESRNPEVWLEMYDVGLASHTDQELILLIEQLKTARAEKAMTAGQSMLAA